MVTELYPFTSRYLTLEDEHRLHYVDEGSGPPVVMVHGNPTWSFFFRDVIKSLKGACRCIAPDHIGMGLSSKPDTNSYSYTLARRIDDLETLLAHLNISEDVTLILHDWGGAIGMGYAVRHPKSIARLVLMNTAAFRNPRGNGLPLGLKAARTMVGAYLIRRFNAFCRAAAWTCTRRRTMPAEVRREYLAPYKDWDSRIGVLRFVQDIPLSPDDASYATLHEIESNLHHFKDVPVLICWGMKDFIFDPLFLETWLEYFPHAECHRFADCGHYLLEDAGEEVIPLIQRFIHGDAAG